MQSERKMRQFWWSKLRSSEQRRHWANQRNGLNDGGYKGWLWLDPVFTVAGLPVRWLWLETGGSGWVNGFGVGVTDGDVWRVGDANGFPVPEINSICLHTNISITIKLISSKYFYQKQLLVRSINNNSCNNWMRGRPKFVFGTEHGIFGHFCQASFLAENNFSFFISILRSYFRCTKMFLFAICPNSWANFSDRRSCDRNIKLL